MKRFAALLTFVLALLLFLCACGIPSPKETDNDNDNLKADVVGVWDYPDDNHYSILEIYRGGWARAYVRDAMTESYTSYTWNIEDDLLIMTTSSLGMQETYAFDVVDGNSLIRTDQQLSLTKSAIQTYGTAATTNPYIW